MMDVSTKFAQYSDNIHTQNIAIQYHFTVVEYSY